MSRKECDIIDLVIEEDINPKHKYNSLISVMVSTLMCIAAKCPLPRSNIETTKLFLRNIIDDRGETPRNVRAFLGVLNDYTGPYESDNTPPEKSDFEEPPLQPTEQPLALEYPIEKKVKIPANTSRMLNCESVPIVETQVMVKKTTKTNIKRGEKEIKKKKTLDSRVSASKSFLK